MVIACVFIVLALFAPKTLTLANQLWFKFGLLLGSIIAPIVMALIYITTIIPTGLYIKITKKDLLLQKLDKNAKTYWITRDHPINTMKDQF